MKIVTIILGILMAICGISCICTPVMTFLEAGYFLVILLLVYGIAAIVKAVAQKEYGMPFLFGILSTVLGIVWFLMQGVVGIVLSFRQKKLKGKGWIGTLILGVLGVLLGLYSLAHPLLLAFTFGVLVGMYFIECGVNMIVLASSIPSEG